MSFNKNPFSFIVVEGPDGAGKTSIVEHLNKKLLDLGLDVVKGRGLGTTNVAETIRSQMFSKKPSSNYEIFAAIMCLIDCHENFIKPNIENGKVVLLDRFIPSYYAYQVSGRGSELAELVLKESFNSACKPTPDIYIYIEVNKEVALSRIGNRGDSNYLDEEVSEYRSKVFDGYKDFFENDMISIDDEYREDPSKAPKVIRLNGNNPLDIVLGELDAKLLKYLT